MSLNDFRMTLFPKIVFNPAIEFAASVNLTSLGIWSDGQPLVGSSIVATSTNVGFANSLYVPLSNRPASVNTPNTIVTLQWLKVTMKTPMLDFSIGFKGSKFGIGLWKNDLYESFGDFCRKWLLWTFQNDVR